MPAPRFRDLRFWESDNWRAFAGSPVNQVYGEPGWVCQDLTNGDFYVHGAGNGVANWIKTGTAAGTGQTGTVALVLGTQGPYAVAFPVAFAAPPTKILAGLLLNDQNATVFTVAANRATITANGCDLWLSGIPAAGDVGGILCWHALL